MRWWKTATDSHWHTDYEKFLDQKKNILLYIVVAIALKVG